VVLAGFPRIPPPQPPGIRGKNSKNNCDQNPHLTCVSQHHKMKSRERSSEAVMSVINISRCGAQILFLEEMPVLIIYKNAPEFFPIEEVYAHVYTPRWQPHNQATANFLMLLKTYLQSFTSANFPMPFKTLPPELREIIYKEYLAIKRRQRKEMGWDKVHEHISELPFCHYMQQIVPTTICFEYANCRFEGCCFPVSKGRELFIKYR